MKEKLKNIFTKAWATAALIRAARTFCQTAVGTIGAAASLGDVKWEMVLSTAALSAILSLLTSVAGLPEIQGEKPKTWMLAAGIRAMKTVAQTAIATVGTATTVGVVDWKLVLSASILSGIVSLATSMGGLPEVEAK